jgi:hypothetical protein
MTLLGVLNKIFNIFLAREKIYSIVGVVSDIDVSTRTCTVSPIDDSPDLFDVRFQASESLSEGINIIPTDGSFVVVSFMNKTTAVIINTSDIDKIEITTDLIEFNGGTLDSMVTINELVTKINRLEDKLKTHQHGYIPYPSGVAGIPVTTTVATALVPPDITLTFTNTIKTDIENTKVKQ